MLCELYNTCNVHHSTVVKSFINNSNQIHMADVTMFKVVMYLVNLVHIQHISQITS